VTAVVAFVTFVGIAAFCTRHHGASLRAAAIAGARAQLQTQAESLAAVTVSHPRRTIELTGWVSRPADRILAEHLVREHPLVFMVANRIEVVDAGPETISDWTGRELLAEDSFESGSMKVGAGALQPAGDSPSTTAREADGRRRELEDW
jgi:hypothetical protein